MSTWRYFSECLAAYILETLFDRRLRGCLLVFAERGCTYGVASSVGVVSLLAPVVAIMLLALPSCHPESHHSDCQGYA